MTQPDLKSQLTLLREEREVHQLQVEIAEFKAEEKAMRQIENLAVFEAWYGGLPGAPVDRFEYTYDDPTFRRGLGTIWDEFQDTEHGDWRPHFQSERDLDQIRGVGQFLSAEFITAQNIERLLQIYTIGKGYKFTAKPVKPRFKGFANRVQDMIDEFLLVNAFTNGLDGEVHNKTISDGEAIIFLIPPVDDDAQTMPSVMLLESTQVVEPANAREVDDWLMSTGQVPLDAFVPSWKYGVLTDARDTSRARGYHVIWDPAGNNWDFLRPEQIQHIKINVPSRVKRGLTDYYVAKDYIWGTERLTKRTVEGATVQAAIAYIIEHAPGMTRSQVADMRASKSWSRWNQPTPHGSIERNVQDYSRTRPLDVHAGTQYKAGPMGAQRVPPFVSIIDSALRVMGTYRQIPSYMISGNLEQTNLASSLVAEGPFNRAREVDQKFYARHFVELLWKAIAMTGELASRNLTMLEAVKQVRIEVEVPLVATRDRLKTAQAAALELQTGTVSRRTIAHEAGRDFDQELARGAEVAQPAQPGQTTGGPKSDRPPGSQSQGRAGADASRGEQQTDHESKETIREQTQTVLFDAD